MSKGPILLLFGKNVQKHRISQGLSQEKLAELAGVHRTYIGMIERAEKNITLNIVATDKASYRKLLIEEFLKEQPGSIKSVTEYYYFVEALQNDKRIYLKRPTALNKGVDFEVRIEDTQFRYGKHGNIISTGNRPSHDDIINDLAKKKLENPIEFNRLKTLLDKTYNC